MRKAIKTAATPISEYDKRVEEAISICSEYHKVLIKIIKNAIAEAKENGKNSIAIGPISILCDDNPTQSIIDSGDAYIRKADYTQGSGRYMPYPKQGRFLVHPEALYKTFESDLTKSNYTVALQKDGLCLEPYNIGCNGPILVISW